MATILKLTDGIAVENDVLRLILPLTGGLINSYSLHARHGSSFELAATVDPLSQVVYRTKDGATGTHKIVAAGYEMDRRGADCILRLESEFHDSDGVRWSAGIEFYVPDEGHRISVTSRLATSRPRQLLAFHGPFLRVPGGPGYPKRRAALFPGLDWVVDDERSSSPDTAPPPFDRRHVPHPYKITVPVMAVAHGEFVTGIAWDPLQIWDGERVESSAHRYPTAVFASPDFTGGARSHLMGLMLPSVPQFMDENSLMASRPYQMTAGRELRLECNLFVRESVNVVDSIREHMHLNGVVPPPPKTRDYRESVELDIETYLDRAWSPKHGAWAHSSSAEEKWTFYSELVALALWRASLFAKDAQLKARLRECVETAIAAHGATSGLSMAYFRGNFATELDLAKGSLDKLVAAQQPDGGWAADDAKVRRREKSLVGVTAENAAVLLRSGLLTGDRHHLNAGTLALRFLDGFDRPSGLRVWDVHEKAPDLLAAAHLVAAYLDLYRITSNPARLERAVYWAWAGLPFVYLWHAHNRDIMRYATVPFFAVTLMDKKPWFGVAAQWNGLIYARQLFHLSRYDRTAHWHRTARAITLCAMQLQKTPEHAPAALTGFYSDAYNVVDGRDYYPLCLNPQLITRNVLGLLGEDIEPSCEVVPWREKRTRIATVAHMLAIRSSPNQIMIRMAYHVGETCYVTIAECDPPAEVRLSDNPLDQVERLTDARCAWQYDEARGLILVRLQFSEREEVLELRFSSS